MAAASATTVIVAAVAGNLAIAVVKFIAAGITGSSAMISEGIHSLVDTGNGVLMWIRTDCTMADVAQAIDRIERGIREQHPEMKYIFLSADALSTGGSQL